MASMWPPKKNTECKLYFSLYKTDNTIIANPGHHQEGVHRRGGRGRHRRLGGPETLMIGREMWDEFISNNDWPMACTVAVVMILLIIVPLAAFNKYQAEAQEARQ